MSFIDEFHDDPTILRAALAAAVGPLPDVEVLPTGWVRLKGTLSAPSPAAALEAARDNLAIYLAVLDLQHGHATATAPGSFPLAVDRIDTSPDGITVTGRIPAELADNLRLSSNVSVTVREPRCGLVDPDEGACILTAGHAGEHFYSMGKVAP